MGNELEVAGFLILIIGIIGLLLPIALAGLAVRILHNRTKGFKAGNPYYLLVAVFILIFIVLLNLFAYLLPGLKDFPFFSIFNFILF